MALYVKKYAAVFHLFSADVTKKQQTHEVLQSNPDFPMMLLTLEKSTQEKRPVLIPGNLELL